MRRRRVPITWVTPEPALGHFGIGGIRGGELMSKAFLKWQGIDYRANSAIKEVTADAVILESGERLPAAWKMLVPPFKGARVIRESPGIGDEKGLVPTDDSYRHSKYPNVFAAGLAVRISNPFLGSVPFGVPKTGYPTDEMAKTVVENIQRVMEGQSTLACKQFGSIPACASWTRATRKSGSSRLVVPSLGSHVPRMRHNSHGTRRLEIAPHLAYGDRGVSGVIPAGAALTAEITIVEPRTGTP